MPFCLQWGAQFNSDLIPEWKCITHMDGFTRLRVNRDDVPLIFIPEAQSECLWLETKLLSCDPRVEQLVRRTLCPQPLKQTQG